MASNVDGVGPLKANLAALPAAVRKVMEDQLYRAAARVQTNVVKDIRIQKIPAGFTGKRRGGPGRRKHIPSPPGGPPNSDTGRLMGSIAVGAGREPDGSPFSVVVENANYAPLLERGTSKMAARPHLLPRFQEEAKVLPENMNAAVSEVLRQGSTRRK